MTNSYAAVSPQSHEVEIAAFLVNFMPTRTIFGQFATPLNATPLTAVVTFVLLHPLICVGTPDTFIHPQRVTVTLVNGAIPPNTTLAVPSTGAAHYLVQLPTDQSYTIVVEVGDAPFDTGHHRLVATLGDGGTKKTVTITGSLQSTQGGSVPASVTPVALAVSTNDLVLVPPTSHPHLVVYGDSIAGGANTANQHKEAWILLTRQAAPFGVAVEAWGFRSLYDDANAAPLRAAFVAKLAALAPSKLWLAIGTNDYGLNKWTAAAFGTSYAAVLDALFAALPMVKIYCQSPLIRGTETANGKGSTLGDYRAQIQAACSSRGFTVYVDGTTILTLSDLDTDQLHPSAAGHAKYARFVRTQLGF